MLPAVTAFLAGVVLSPVVGGVLRPVAKGTIKGAMLVAQHTKRIAHEVREDLEDLTAEAAAETQVSAPKAKSTRSTKNSS